MRKYFYLFMCSMTLVFSMSVLTGCDKEDNDEYYAGESEEDYKPNTYIIDSSWDFSRVSGLTSDEISSLKKDMDSSCKASEVFNTKSDAITAFNEFVSNLADDSDMKEFKGAKAELRLKRGTAIIKKSTISW